MQATPALSICLALSGGLTLGCYSSNVATPAPKTNTAIASVPKKEDSKRDSNVAVASHQASSSATDERRVRVTIQFVEFQESPTVDAALQGLWKEAASDAKESSGSLESQSTIVVDDEISTLISDLENQGLAKRYRPWKKDVLSGQRETWGSDTRPAGREITATATVRSDDCVEVSFNSNPTTAAFGNDQNLVIAGPTTTGTVTEITQIPFLGDIPIIGPRYFNKITSRKEVHKSLYLVTAEVISE